MCAKQNHPAGFNRGQGIAEDAAPVIGLTMGDPLGIGPEIIVKALADSALRDQAAFVIHGLNQSLMIAADRADLTPDWWRLTPGKQPPARLVAGQVLVIDYVRQVDVPTNLDQLEHQPSRFGGSASLEFVNEAIRSALLPASGLTHLDAIVTAPISKASWSLAGLKRFPGHTELFANRTGAKRFGMLFVAPQLRVVLATIHIPLMQVREALNIGSVLDAIDLGNQACGELLGIAEPRLAVCGLNPHASEGGLFGDEEARIITPAITQAVERGINCKGPFPADTIFNAAVQGRFDLVVAMYHDQGLIPVKLLARDEAVNVTIGLPIIRTSPDHGTAFDIAGKNRADPGSMKAAIRLAIEMSRRPKSRAVCGGPGGGGDAVEGNP